MPEVYVSSLADEYTGKRHGTWVFASMGEELIRTQIKIMLAKSSQPKAKDWSITNWRGFGSLTRFEDADAHDIAESVRLMTEYGIFVTGIIQCVGGACCVEEAREWMEQRYRGEFDSLATYARQWTEHAYGEVLESLPRLIRDGIDFQAIGGLMHLRGDISYTEWDGRVHVFEGLLEYREYEDW